MATVHRDLDLEEEDESGPSDRQEVPTAPAFPDQPLTLLMLNDPAFSAHWQYALSNAEGGDLLERLDYER